MILHLFWDEKITNRIIKTFEEVFPDNNTYIYWYNSGFKHHFAHENDKCHIINSNRDCLDIDFSKYDKVILHGLDINKIKFCIENISLRIPIYWILWGAELYNSLLFSRGYKLYYRSSPPISQKTKLSRILKRMGILSKNDKLLFDFFKERDVTMVCSKKEFEIFRSYYPKETQSLKNQPDYFYYPIDEILGETLKQQKAQGNIILVGNSASWTNNHEYVFDCLKQYDLSDKLITLPLSYGGNDDYIKKIDKKGIEYFGDKYKSLHDYLPLDRYNSLMANAEICIYGSWRQEAVGNIVVALYLGAKVFLSEKNPLLNLFKEQGIVIYKFEDISQESLDNPLTDEEKEHNRILLAKSNSWTRLKQLTYNIFK